jgi:hypothetical protein
MVREGKGVVKGFSCGNLEFGTPDRLKGVGEGIAKQG